MASLVQRPEDSHRHPQGDGTGGEWELGTRVRPQRRQRLENSYTALLYSALVMEAETH